MAREANVELMTDAIVSEERDLLLSPEFEVKLAGIARKSFGVL